MYSHIENQKESQRERQREHCVSTYLTKTASMQEAIALRRDLPPRPLPPPPPRGLRLPGKPLLRP